jgi:hypothetical protein
MPGIADRVGEQKMNASTADVQQNGNGTTHPLSNVTPSIPETNITFEAAKVGPLTALLKEYSSKLKVLIETIQDSYHFMDSQPSLLYPAYAWQLDSAEEIQPLLRAIMSRASALQEHATTGSLISEELALRFVELRTHWHHLLSCTYLLREKLKQEKVFDHVQKFRFASGQNVLKSVSLRSSLPQLGYIHMFDSSSWKKTGDGLLFELNIPFSAHGVQHPTTTVQINRGGGWEEIGCSVLTTDEAAVTLVAAKNFAGRCIIK